MKTGMKYWLSRGFINAEASAFKDITVEALQESTYMKRMVNDRVKRFLRAGRDGLTAREYHFRIRKMYIDAGLANGHSDLLLRGLSKQRNKARSTAFKLFNHYKDEYGARTPSGQLIETPRKKVKVSKKPITGKRTVDQAIRKHQDEAERIRAMLKFPMEKSRRDSLNTQLSNHLKAIDQLKKQG